MVITYLYFLGAACPLAALNVAHRQGAALLDPLFFQGIHLPALRELETSHLGKEEDRWGTSIYSKYPWCEGSTYEHTGERKTAFATAAASDSTSVGFLYGAWALVLYG